MNKKMYYVTILSNFSIAYNKYKNVYSKKNIPAKFSDKFFLIDKANLSIGIEKNLLLLQKKENSEDKILILETMVTNDELFNDHETGIGYYVKRNYINIYNVYLYENENLVNYLIEEIVALSIRLQKLHPYSKLKPRSFSILPVAKGCQASCSFCFSSSSISNEFSGTFNRFNQLSKFSKIAKQKGAIRAVITGGGEPTLMPKEKLYTLISLLKNDFDKVVLITNAYWLVKLVSEERKEALNKLQDSGLSVLSISHHHFNLSIKAKIMNLEIDIGELLTDLKTYSFVTRLICVLQKGGIETHSDIDNYLSYAVEYGISEICFKELYISTSTESKYYDKESNIWSRENQISLSVLTSYLEMSNFKKVHHLPWGSPVYSGTVKNKVLKIAVYTEPSLFWERQNGIARSWNMMSDGSVYSTLEDKNSKIYELY